MKKITLTLGLLASMCLAQAQQIVNGGFEVWKQRTGHWLAAEPGGEDNTTYYDMPQSSADYQKAITAAGLSNVADANYPDECFFMRTLNNLAEIQPGGGTPPVEPTCTRWNKDVYNGEYCARAKSVEVTLGGKPLFIPGIYGTVIVDFQNATAQTTIMPNYTQKPTKLTGAIKYLPVDNDEAEVFIRLFYAKKFNKVNVLHANGYAIVVDASNNEYVQYKKDDNLYIKYGEKEVKVTQDFLSKNGLTYKTLDIADVNSLDTLAYASKKWSSEVSDWEDFSLDINYLKEGTPNCIQFFFTSSAGYDFVDLYNCKGGIGSQLFIDDIAFVGGVPVAETSASTLVYGSTGKIKVEGESTKVSVYALDGTKVFEGVSNEIDAVAGVYVVVVDGVATKVIVK
jgi:hypothetical protein